MADTMKKAPSGIKKALVTGKIITFARNYVERVTGEITRKILFGRGEVEPLKLVFNIFENTYTCNAKAIAEEILRQELPIDIVWVVGKKTNTDVFPEGIRTVVRNSYEMYEELATARVWVDNALNCVWQKMPKKKEQVYINTWHGSMGIKQLSGDSYWMKRAALLKNTQDYCITNSQFEEEVFRSTFWPTNEFLRYGHPRNDILFDPAQQAGIREKILESLGILEQVDENTHFCLYAPTFRDDKSKDCYDVDFVALKEALEKRFGGNWMILVRMHFKNRKNAVVPEEEWVVDGNRYPNMQELMTIADLGITDYSSWAYDYILTGRPMVIYAKDLEKYAGGRGFYYPIETTPFPIARSNGEMTEKILAFDMEKYAEDCRSFLKERGCYEDGHASERTVKKLKEIMGL